MKFTFSSVIALAAISGTDAVPGVRKVPPRTPPQRLDTLVRFAKEYIENNVKTVRPGPRTKKTGEITDRQYGSMKTNYEKLRKNGSGLRRCSFFSPNVPNGGPRPVSENNKRAAEPWVAKELCALGELDQCSDSEMRHRRQAENDGLDFDPFDEYENELQESRSTAAVRLSNNRALALRQLRTGFQKWILRYISECNGQKFYGAHTKRLRRMTHKIHEAMANTLGTYGPDGTIPLKWEEANWNENRFFAEDEAKPGRPNRED